MERVVESQAQMGPLPGAMPPNQVQVQPSPSDLEREVDWGQVNTWHRDGISDMAWAFSGEQWFLLSASRDGVIKAWK